MIYVPRNVPDPHTLRAQVREWHLLRLPAYPKGSAVISHRNGLNTLHGIWNDTSFRPHCLLAWMGPNTTRVSQARVVIGSSRSSSSSSLVPQGASGPPLVSPKVLPSLFSQQALSGDFHLFPWFLRLPWRLCTRVVQPTPLYGSRPHFQLPSRRQPLNVLRHSQIPNSSDCYVYLKPTPPRPPQVHLGRCWAPAPFLHPTTNGCQELEKGPIHAHCPGWLSVSSPYPAPTAC